MSMCSSPRKPQRKPKPERVDGLGLPGQRGVVEGELLERVAQVRVVVGVDREQAAEHHRLDLAVAGQRLGDRAALGGQRVADAQPGDVLDPGDQEADLAGVQRGGRGHLRGEEADVVDLGLGAGLHGADRLALGERAVDDADVGDHAAVLVELGVEDQRPRRRVGIAARRRHARDQLVEHVGDALAGLGADPPHVVGRLAEQLGDLLGDALGLGAGQVDLVQARDQLEPGLDRQVGVGHRLRLDALGRVDDQQRALAGGQRARHLVGEVDVAGRVDQVQLVGLPVVCARVEHPHRLRLDRDPALALEVHRVEHLGAHRARVDRVGQLEDAVGQRRLAVVDVGDDREVADVGLVSHVSRVLAGPVRTRTLQAAQSGAPLPRGGTPGALDLTRLGHAHGQHELGVEHAGDDQRDAHRRSAAPSSERPSTGRARPRRPAPPRP